MAERRTVVIVIAVHVDYWLSCTAGGIIIAFAVALLGVHGRAQWLHDCPCAITRSASPSALAAFCRVRTAAIPHHPCDQVRQLTRRRQHDMWPLSIAVVRSRLAVLEVHRQIPCVTLGELPPCPVGMCMRVSTMVAVVVSEAEVVK